MSWVSAARLRSEGVYLPNACAITQEKGGGEKGEGMGNNETFQSVQNGTSETAINANKTI